MEAELSWATLAMPPQAAYLLMDTRFRSHIAAVRIFLAVLFALLGLSLLFSTVDGNRLLLGAVLGALGITSLLLLWAETRAQD